jgi:hypothetical protein
VAPEIALVEQILEVGWEIEKRREVYQRRVDDGRMTALEAGRKISIMKAALESLVAYKALMEAKL